MSNAATSKGSFPTAISNSSLATATASTTFATSTTPTTAQQIIPETGSPTATRILTSKSGLSIGAKAGIGSAAGFAGVLILAIVAWCVLGCRRRDKDLGHLQWLEKRGVLKDRVEMDGQGRVEMEAPVWEKVKKMDVLKAPLNEDVAVSPISPLPPVLRGESTMRGSDPDDMVSPVTPPVDDRSTWI